MIDQAEAFESTTSFRLDISGIGVLAMLFGLLIAVVLTRMVTRPILALQDGVARFGKGDLAVRLPEKATDELGILARQFNLMVSALAEKDAQLHSYASRLEDNVAELCTLFAAMTDIIFVLDGDGRYLKIAPTNPPHQLKLDPTLIGKTLQEIFPTDQSVLMFKNLQQALATHQTISAEYSLLLNDMEAWFSVTVSPLSDNSVIWVLRNITERKRAEETLRQSENMYRALLEEASDGVFIADSAGRYVLVNEQGCRMLGYTREELLQMSMRDLIAPDDLNTQPLQIDQLRSGKTLLFERHMLRKVGTSILVEISAKMLPDGRLQGLVRDISERKRTEDEIRDTAARLRVALSSVDISIFNQDRDLRYTWMYQPQRNFELSEILGRTDFDLVPLEAAEKLHQLKRRVIDSNSGDRQEIEVVLTDETTFYDVIVEPLHDAAGNVVGITGASLDITERKRSEEALRYSEERYRSVIAALAEGLVIHDEQGKITTCNANAELVLGLKADQLMGITSIDPSWHTIHEDGSPFPGESHPAMITLHTGQAQQNVVMGVYKPDGSLSWISVNSQPLIRPNESKPYAVIASFVDITQRKQGEDNLRKLNRTLTVLSNVNQAIVHIRPISVLFEDVCRIAVEDGGFRMVWIGMLDTETRQVNPVAHAGLALDYLEKLDIIVDGGPRGLGPTGRAVSSGEYVVSQDMQDDPRLGPWIRDVIRLDYRASAAFPLKVAGEVRGVLTLYANTVNFFNDEEIKLLGEMSEDLSFAMEFAEQEEQRQQAEVALRYHMQALEEMRVFLQTTFDAFPANTAVLDGNGNILDVNLAWMNFADENDGKSPIYYVGVNYLAVCETATRSESGNTVSAVDGIKAVIQGTQDEFHLEYPCHSPSEKRWYIMRVTPFPEPAPRRVVVAHINITERKQALELLQEAHNLLEQRVIARTAELQDSKQRVEAILNNSPEAMLLVSPDLHIQQANPAFSTLFLSHLEAYFDKSLLELIHEDDAQKMGEIYQSNAAEKLTKPLEIRARRGDGTFFDADISIGSIKDKGLVCIISDVTERKRADEALRNALAAEKELSELKTRFVSMASHEFRTPLATIRASTDTLSAYRHKMSDDQVEQKLDKIKDQVDYLKDIMDDVLLLARIQARRVEFNPVDLDLNALCQTVIEEFRSRPDIHHQLVYTCDGLVHNTKLDKKLMRQIGSNLISNAIKYSSEDKPVAVHLEFASERIVLKVSDQGIGISDSDQKHLFQPFHRGNNVGSISGTGLGLVIAKDSVEMHGGTISLSSQVGLGTVVTVNIPTVYDRGTADNENSGD